MTLHGWQEMAADALTLGDVHEVLSTGHIVERQRDSRTGESKYVVKGKAVDGRRATVVTKLGPTGRLVIITVYSSGNEAT